MNRADRLPAALLGVLLGWGVLSLWIEERWAWALFQIGIFAIAGWRVLVGRPLVRGFAILPLAAAALWPLLQLALGATLYPAATWSAALDWGTFFLVFVLAQELFRDPEARHRFLSAAAIFAMVMAAAATIGKYACPGKILCLFDSGFSADVMGPFVNRNQYCAWMELLLPAALYLAAANPRLRSLFGTAAAVMAGSVVASASRAGIGLVAAEILVATVALAVRHSVLRRGMALGVAQFVLLGGIAIAVGGWQDAVGRWRNSGPEEVRKDALRASLQMVQARPWTGSGLGTWSRVYPRYAGIDDGVFVNQAHNDWVQWAAEGGLPFVLLLFIFAALLCKPAVQSIYGLGMLAFLLHALVDYPMQQRPALAAWFFCMAGVAGAWRNRADLKP